MPIAWSRAVPLAVAFTVAAGCSQDPGAIDGAGLPDASLGIDASLPVDPVGWRSTGALHHARVHATATRLLDGRVLVIGGDDDQLTMLDSAEIYDPAAGLFHDAAPLPAASAYHTATLLPDGKVLVAGGGPGSEISIPTGEADVATALLYDPAMDRWSQAEPMHFTRAGHQAVALVDGRVLVMGGGSGVGYPCAAIHPHCTVATSIASAEIYDPQSGQWTVTGELAQARLAFTATRLASGKVLAAGGGAQNMSLTSVEIFDPDQGQWTTAKPMAAQRLFPAQILLGNGDLLVTGGKIANVAPITESELFHESDGTWKNAAKLAEARTGAIGIRLPSGHAIIVAGNDQLGTQYLADVEIYDDAADRWRAIDPLAEGRYGHTATLLTDGTLLVAGGLGDNGLLDSAERSR